MKEDDFQSKWGRRLFSLMNLFYDRYSSLPNIEELNVIVASSIGSLDADEQKELKEITMLVTTMSKWDVREKVIRDIAGKYLKDMRVTQAILQVSENKDDLPFVLQTLNDAAKFELATQEMTRWSDLSRLDKAQDILRKMPLGYETFDDMTQGGILRPSLMIVCGKPYSGKTQVLLNLADNLMLGGYKVLYFSMELNNNLLMMRSDAARLGRHYQEIYLPENIKETKAALKKQMRNQTGDLTIIKYPPGVSIGKLKIHADIFATVYGPVDCIMFDYLGLITPSSSQDGMYKSGKAVAEELVTIGEEHDAGIVAAAQTNKGAAQVNIRDLNESHIGESWGIQQVGYDVVMLSKSDSSLMARKLHVKWVKNRSGGRLGITSLYEIPNTFKLTDNVSDMFELASKAGVTLLPEEMTALMEAQANNGNEDS